MANPGDHQAEDDKQQRPITEHAKTFTVLERGQYQIDNAYNKKSNSKSGNPTIVSRLIRFLKKHKYPFDSFLKLVHYLIKIITSLFIYNSYHEYDDTNEDKDKTSQTTFQSIQEGINNLSAIVRSKTLHIKQHNLYICANRPNNQTSTLHTAIDKHYGIILDFKLSQENDISNRIGELSAVFLSKIRKASMTTEIRGMMTTDTDKAILIDSVKSITEVQIKKSLVKCCDINHLLNESLDKSPGVSEQEAVRFLIHLKTRKGNVTPFDKEVMKAWFKILIQELREKGYLKKETVPLYILWPLHNLDPQQELELDLARSTEE